MFSTIEFVSRNLASRERIYKNYGVAGPASALSSLSHKLKGGRASTDGPFLMNVGAFKKEVLVHFSHFHLIPLRLKFIILFKLGYFGVICDVSVQYCIDYPN